MGEGSPGRFIAVGMAILAVFVLAGIGVFNLAGSFRSGGNRAVTATPLPVPQVAQQPQLIQCLDGAVRATCPPVPAAAQPANVAPPQAAMPQVPGPSPIVPTNTPAPVATNTPVPPTSTPVPPTPTPVPQVTPTATPIPAPTIQQINQVLATCNARCPSDMQTQVGANQAILVHGDLTNSSTICTYKVYRTGQTVPSSFGKGTFQVVLIQGPPEYIDASIKSDVAGAAGAAPTGTCPAG